MIHCYAFRFKFHCSLLVYRKVTNLCILSYFSAFSFCTGNSLAIPLAILHHVPAPWSEERGQYACSLKLAELGWVTGTCSSHPRILPCIDLLGDEGSGIGYVFLTQEANLLPISNLTHKCCFPHDKALLFVPSYLWRVFPVVLCWESNVVSLSSCMSSFLFVNYI